jgi:hypothetical protein
MTAVLVIDSSNDIKTASELKERGYIILFIKLGGDDIVILQ